MSRRKPEWHNQNIGGRKIKKMDIVIDFLSTIIERHELVFPVIAIAVVFAVCWILFSNVRDALFKQITHKRNKITSIILALVFFVLLLVAVDRTHFHITIFVNAS